MTDLHNIIQPVRVRSPAVAGTTGTKAGQVIDMAGFESIEFIIANGAQGSSVTVTPVIKSGSATGSLASCADSELLGTEAAAAALLAGAGGANAVAKIGYIGSDRYVTCDLIIGGAATGVHSVVGIQGGPRKAPTT